jgi:hypothetical protein
MRYAMKRLTAMLMMDLGGMLELLIGENER